MILLLTMLVIFINNFQVVFLNFFEKEHKITNNRRNQACKNNHFCNSPIFSLTITQSTYSDYNYYGSIEEIDSNNVAFLFNDITDQTTFSTQSYVSINLLNPLLGNSPVFSQRVGYNSCLTQYFTRVLSYNYSNGYLLVISNSDSNNSPTYNQYCLGDMSNYYIYSYSNSIFNQTIKIKDFFKDQVPNDGSMSQVVCSVYSDLNTVFIMWVRILKK